MLAPYLVELERDISVLISRLYRARRGMTVEELAVLRNLVLTTASNLHGFGCAIEREREQRAGAKRLDGDA